MPKITNYSLLSLIEKNDQIKAPERINMAVQTDTPVIVMNESRNRPRQKTTYRMLEGRILNPYDSSLEGMKREIWRGWKYFSINSIDSRSEY